MYPIIKLATTDVQMYNLLLGKVIQFSKKEYNLINLQEIRIKLGAEKLKNELRPAAAGLGADTSAGA